MKLKMILSLVTAYSLFSCATIDKADLKSDNPDDAIVEVESLKTDLKQSQGDVIAESEFNKADEYLNEARRSLTKDENEKEVLKDLAISKAYFLKAEKTMNERSSIPTEILDSRKRAVLAGAASVNNLKKRLIDIDDDLQSSTSYFSQTLSAEKFSDIQKKYLDLEVIAVQDQELSDFRKIIKKAIKQNANDLAANTLRNAETDLAIAENLIAQNPRDEKRYILSIDKANKSAKLLKDVMSKLTGQATGSSEKVALKLVYQERELGKLTTRVENLRGDLMWRSGELVYTENKLEEQKEQTVKAQNRIAFQKAIESARSSFSNDAVMAYQQDNKLIFRLKKIDFKTNSAKVPANADPVISKISNIIEELYPAKVLIQGHTDATGSKEYNKTLSKKRASSVKDLMSSLNENVVIEAQGYGEEMPIANNQTVKGRSENRRVDIIVEVK